MSTFAQPQPCLPNLDAFIREQERHHAVNHRNLELTSVLYEEDRTIVFEKKLLGDGKTIVSIIPNAYTSENDYTQVIPRFLAKESTCRDYYPEAF